VKDWPRYQRALSERGESYLALRNRNERLEASSDGRGYRCDWQWTSDLHAPKFMPSLGLRLIERALNDHPIRRVAAPETIAKQPDVSFVIGHRGTERLPHLLATLESIAGQREVSVECVVVEQSARPEVRDQLPEWISYIHTPLPYGDLPYARAWAFNVGARAARSEVLVLHDNDMLVPTDYAKEVIARLADGYEVMNLKRFIFYLNQTHSAAVLSDRESPAQQPPEVVVQNLEAGGSVAITRRAYERIGGMDESFVGWGSEDNEFWERSQTLNLWPFGYLPIVHLWHAPQSGKLNSERSTAKLYEERSVIPVSNRIAELTARDFGNAQAPYGSSLARRA
jgi:hypothetical protein